MSFDHVLGTASNVQCLKECKPLMFGGGGGGPDPKYNFLKVLGDTDFFAFHLHESYFSYKKKIRFFTFNFLYSVVVT